MTPKLKRKLFLYASFAIVLLMAYFANTAIQTHLGRKALAETQLEMHSLEEALKLAKAQSKTVLADLSAIWCPACRKLDKHVFSHKDVRETLQKHYIFARIEYESEEGKSFMKTYDVKGFPVLLLLDAEGKKIRQLPLTFQPSEFLQQLNRSS